MVSVPVQCPSGQSAEGIQASRQANGAQRYQCQNRQCERRIFLLHYQHRARVPEVRRQVVEMAINGSGVRDTARVWRISPTTVIAVLKKGPALQHANPTVLPPRRSRALSVSVGRAAELDEMWSFVGAKGTARWLRHALDPHTGRVLTYIVGTRKDAVFLKLRALLAPFGITRYYPDKASV